ncbi:MAG: dTDP-glucose 4,6-dehydratase [Dehalococcoidia bacterium]
MSVVLVTGGCGFIGSHFIRLVLQRTDWRVVNLDKLTYAGNLENLEGVAEGPAYRFVRGDIGDRDRVDSLLREERPWGVVNFAAESHVDRSILDSSPFFQTNVYGVQVMLEAGRQSGVERFVQVSTDEVYGDADGKDPFHEDSPLCPSSPYAASKAAADLLCLSYRRTYGLPILIARSSNNYGPRQFPEKLIPFIIRSALNGQDIPVYGDGLQRRDWLYVQDNCQAILDVLECGRLGAIYNVATGVEWTNLEAIQSVCRLLARQVGLDLDTLLQRVKLGKDRPGHDRRYALSTQRIHRELGWAPQVSFENGLKHTVRWYLESGDWAERVVCGEYRDYYEAVYLRAWGQSSK